MKKIDKIIAILKEFETRNIKRCIAPENYAKVADKIYKELIKPEIEAKKCALIQLQDIKDMGY